MNTKNFPQGPKIIEIPKNSREFMHDFIPIIHNFKSLIFDLGVGTGDSSLMLCQKHPESLVVAIERTSAKFLKFKNKILSSSQSSNNLMAVHSDYNQIVPLILSQISTKQISVFWFYPNPAYKNKNKNHRYYNQEAFKAISQLSFINLEIRTDQEKQLFQVATLLKNPPQISELHSQGEVPISDFEKKYLEQKRILYRLVAQTQA